MAVCRLVYWVHPENKLMDFIRNFWRITSFYQNRWYYKYNFYMLPLKKQQRNFLGNFVCIASNCFFVSARSFHFTLENVDEKNKELLPSLVPYKFVVMNIHLYQKISTEIIAWQIKYDSCILQFKKLLTYSRINCK